MPIPRIPRRWRLQTLMVMVALCAVGLGAYRLWVERGPVYRLIWQLRTGDAQNRREAAFEIGLLGPRAALAVGALDSALDDPDQYVRANAMYSLVRLVGSRSPRLLPILAEQIENTREPDQSDFRQPVTWIFGYPPLGWTWSDGGLYYNDPVNALKMIRPDAKSFLPLLGKPLKSPARWVREAALEALFAVATWSDPSSPEVIGALLGVMDDYPLDPRVVGLVARGQYADRKRVAEALARLDRLARERAATLLTADLRDVGSPRSFEAAVLLRRFDGGTALVVSILRDRIGGGDQIQRRIAMILLEQFGKEAVSAAPDVLRGITDPGADSKVPLGNRLDWWWDVGRGEEWRGEFRHVSLEAPDGRTSAMKLGVRALKAMGSQVKHGAIGELIAIVREPGADLHRRCCASIAPGEFGPDAGEAIPALDAAIREYEAADHGASRGFAASDSLGAQATMAVGWIAADGNPNAIAVLSRLVADPGANVAHFASWMLVQLGPKARSAVPSLVTGLKDPRQAVRASSASALAKIGGPEVRAVLPALMAALDDEDHVVRYHAAVAVAQYGAEAKAAVPRIVELVWDSGPDPDIARSLGRIGPDAAAAIPPLLFWDVQKPMWSDDVRKAMEMIMPRTPGATVADSIAAMRGGDRAGRARAAYELGLLIEKPPHSAEAVAALGEAIVDPDPFMRRIAGAISGRMAPKAPAAGPPLSLAVADPDGSVRRLAAWGLGRVRH
jgi:HEAT repeat protein